MSGCPHRPRCGAPHSRASWPRLQPSQWCLVPPGWRELWPLLHASARQDVGICFVVDGPTSINT
eukprot:357182-Chlamydomonas_euryale.AAC.2